MQKAISNIEYLKYRIEGLGCAVSDLERKVDILEMINKRGDYPE